MAAASLIPNPLEASIHGSATAAAANNNRTIVNTLPNAWANLAKGFSFNVPQGNSPNANGYPQVVQAADITANGVGSPGYFGDYVWSWAGISAMQFSQAALIRSSQLGGVATNAVVAGLSGQTGDTSGNTTIINKTAPRVVMTFGAVLSGANGPGGLAMSDSGISNNAGGNYIKVWFKTGYVSNFSGLGTINQLKLQNSPLNGNLVGQLNALDTWNYVQVDGNSIYLTKSVTTGLPSAYNSGSPWISGGEVVTTATNLSVHIMGSNNGATSYSSPSQFSNFVFCTTINEAAVLAGQINDPTLRDQYKYLMNSAAAPNSQKGWLRFMDVSGVQGSYESDFANRMPVGALCYNTTNYTQPVYSVGTITNTSDALTCSDPSQSVWSGSAYIDNSIVQGAISASNTTANPTLNVGGHGAKPIFDFTTNPNIFRISAPPASAGLTMQWTFSAASWTSPQLNGGSTYTFSYTTVPGDTGSIAAFNANLYNALIADATLAAAKIFFTNSAQVDAYPRTAQAGALTITYTSGPAICTMTRIDPNVMGVNNGVFNQPNSTFIYNQILGGWIYQPGGLTVNVPMESIVELCNQVGAHCWYNWPVYTSAAYVTAFTQFMADATTGLTSGLRFGAETGNELWNFSAKPFGFTQYLGCGMGFPSGGEQPQWSWGALRTVQYASLSRAAWTGKGRSLSDHYILQMNRYSEAFPGQNFEQYGLKGQLLTTSNLIYNAWSGFGGIAVTDYSTSPNRPVDLINASGFAGYWLSDYIRSTTYSNDTIVYGTVSDNAVWLQAAKDYGQGNTATAFSALATMFNTMRGGASIASGSYSGSTLTLTLNAPVNAGTAAPGDIVHLYSLTGVGSSVSGLNNRGFLAVAPTSGTTISLNVGSGLTITSISGGMAVDETAGGQNPDQSSNWPSLLRAFNNWETILSAYDSSAGRATNGVNAVIENLHYEGGPQWSLSTNVTNGTNSTSDAESLAALTFRIGSGGTTPANVGVPGLNWNVSAYTLSGTNTASEMAQMCLNMIQGWKLDVDHTGAAANTGSYKNMIKTSYYQALKTASASSGRENRGGQYGYQANTWGLFPGPFQQGGQYTNYDAIHEFNA